jgi:hypothetical protein
VLGNLLDLYEQWRRVFSMRRRTKRWKSRGQSQLPPLFLSSPVRPAKHPKTQQAVDFSFSFLCFQICVFLFFSVLDLLLYRSVLFLFCFSFSVSGGRLDDQEGRRLLGFCLVWPAEMEKRSVVARSRWSCCGDGGGG